MYNISAIRKDFPVLSQSIRGKRNAFLDTAASAQKPQIVLDQMMKIYQTEYANVHRGSYWLSEEITSRYEEARSLIHQFINASETHEVVFTRNATEAINLVAATWGVDNLTSNDAVLISEAEHHANMVTWQALSEKIGFTLNYFELDDNGAFNMQKFQEKLTPQTKLVAFTAMSNVLGTIFPVKDIVAKAHEIGALALVDGCQYVVHNPVDVQAWDCDFLAFSGHKLYGPTGIGVLYGKYAHLAAMPPYQYGGDMIRSVSFSGSTYEAPPARFEAGTPAIVQAIGLGEAIKYVTALGMENILAHEQELTQYTLQKLSTVEGLELLGNAPDRGGVFSFVLDGIHPQDVAFVLDQEGISVRTGHHCAEPLVNKHGHQSLVRASLGLYSNQDDIDQLVAALNKSKTFF